MVEEATPTQIHPGETERVLRVPARDLDEVVVDTERVGAGVHTIGDVARQRCEDELAEHHVLHDPLPILAIVGSEHRRERIGSERLQLPVVDVEARHRLRRGSQQRGLHVGEPGRRCHGSGDATRDAKDLVGVGVGALDPGARRGHGRQCSGRGWR